MTPDQHTIAELQELVEHLRDKLADAESCCAAQRAWIDATFENCSVFSDPPKVDCGKDYISRRELRELLHKYARHHSQCVLRLVTAGSCTCGLDAVLKEGK